MIEHLLRTTEENSRKYESLKAAIGCNENTDGNQDATYGCIPSRPDLAAGSIPIEAPSKSRTKGVLEAPKVDSMTTKVEYYTLMENLMAEIEAEKYNIEPDVRRRIRDDVIRTHEREIWLLRAIHEHAESREKMREKPWRLLEIAEDMADKGKHPRIEKSGQSSSGAKPGPFPSDLGAQFLDTELRYSSHEIETQNQMNDNEGSSTKARTTTMDQIPAPTINATELFLDNCEDPWNHFHLLFDAPLIDQPRAAEENGWLPYWRSGASMRAFHRILPLNPLKGQLEFLRSCTSMLVTEESHTVETVAWSQDLAALTDSTDTGTYVSARSELGDVVLETHALCLEEGEKDGPLVVLGDQGYFDAVGKDDGRLGAANFNLSLDELLVS